jgi:hypothetical protein
VAQPVFAESYREEARKLQALPESVPAPRLQWYDDGDWVVVGLEYVDAHAPARPWRTDELDLALDALEVVADELTPVPDGMGLEPLADELADWPAMWDAVRDRDTRPHADEAAALAATFAEVAAGDTVVHTDIRDDNVLLTDDGRTLFCDWNWPVAGADWLDSLILLISPRGDGLDVERIVAERRLLRDVPADHVDRVLALLAGYLLSRADEPVPASSPHLRDAQRVQGEAAWGWLCERRGWRDA